MEISVAPIILKGENYYIALANDITERKRLERQNQVLADIIKRSQDFIGVADFDQNAFFVNPAGQVLVGLDGDEAVASTRIEEYFLPENLPFVKGTILPAVMKHGRWAGEFRFRHFKTGEPVPVLYELFLTENPETGAVTNFATITRDITGRKQAEAKLEQSELQKNLILNNTQEMFAFYDLDLNIIWANKASAASVGMTQDEMVGKPCYEVWHHRNVPCERCIVLKAKETKQPQKGEATTPDGKIWSLRGYPVFDEQGKVVNLIELGMDVTAKKQAEAALLESEDRFRKLASFTVEGIIIHNNAIAIDVNQSAVRMLGYEREELTGMHLLT